MKSHREKVCWNFPQVSREKAIADEEELKVNQINREVSTKQKDCEEDLKKAEPGEFVKSVVHKWRHTLKECHIFLSDPKLHKWRHFLKEKKTEALRKHLASLH